MSGSVTCARTAVVADDSGGSLGELGDADAGAVIEMRRTAADAKVARVMDTLQNWALLISPG